MNVQRSLFALAAGIRNLTALAAALLYAAVLVSVAAFADEHTTTPTARAEKSAERGPVSAVVSVEPESVRIGDAVTFTLEVTAKAGVELLMPAFGSSLERFEILQFVPRERVDDEGNTVATQTYELFAASSGTQSVPPVTVEFVDRRPGQRQAPEDEDAYELLTERLAFTVESVVPQSAGNALKAPLGGLEPLGTPLHEKPANWFALGALLLLGAIAAFWFLRRMRGDKQQQSAYAVALGRLTALEAKPRPQSDAAAMDGFFVELSGIVRRYVEDRFGLHAPELTTEEFLDVAAGSPDLTQAHRGFLQTFLRSADQVKFARHVPQTNDVEAALAAVRGFLQQTAEQDTKGPAAPQEEAAHA